ncbi:MAPEG family protein [Psychrobacter sanguinis]|uniref:MAPEG family protein n=1 Tax=Psychrobacter sanguinis TaxID=861445 RepID=UPI001918F095|nr:MAPEG family protein [Psychrobacter sanguinis]MCC3309131.1 MAPEG family protein [Psychrobacter sanguinis]UEC26859.1 MAPEG family protein [Psychrobacter sanguinis]
MSWFFALIPDTANVAIWSMMIASVLPLLFAILAKVLGGFGVADNSHPRDVVAKYTGRAARANAAQQNSYESLPIFLASVIVAMLFFVPQVVINYLAVVYVMLRVIYGIAYIVNLPTLRSIIWTLSMACCFMLFYLAIKMAF